eukprot:TRINITY_DN8555_c0_g1_i1.p1 TRINITY_DN8555_c0_g1~~TRINITY_DN8555_c0_g1_i1.p1  ORF type:complete len:400 (+),score=63.09 TRINITY_DN8555_c0_g1_i1:102-1301(+)
MSKNSPARVLVAFDKFKDCLSAEAIGTICVEQLHKLFPGKISTDMIALSDGGEGFVNALKIPLNLHIKKHNVTGPLGDHIEAEYGYNSDAGVAVIEMASASGLEKVPIGKRNPMYTTTKGTGELIMAAYDAGFRKILLGVGGSATNDGGLGALQAMGVKLKVDDVVEPVAFCGQHLPQLIAIEVPHDLLPGLHIEISCDVTSPFVGPKGAVYTFSGQKGASEADKVTLEKGMVRAAELMAKATGVDVSDIPGAGAAGGMPGGFIGCLGRSRVTLKKGFDFIAEAHGLYNSIAEADLILTGEGSYDATSSGGKVPYQVVQHALKHNKPVVIICGRKDLKSEDEISLGGKMQIIDLLSMFPVEKSMTQTKECLQELLTKRSPSFPVLSSISAESTDSRSKL